MDTNKVINTLGLDSGAFEPNAVTESDRLDAIEEAIIELAEMMLGGDE